MFKSYRIGMKQVRAVVTKPEKGPVMGVATTLVHVNKGLISMSGSVLFERGDARYLLGAHHVCNDDMVFLGYPINEQVEIQHYETTKSSLTGQRETRVASGPMRRAWACRAVLTPEQVMGLTISKKVYFLVERVTSSSTLNGQTISNIAEKDGIYRVEVG